MRILLIEDNQDLRQLISTHLTARGFAVTTAATGALGIAAAAQADALILDLGLPDLDGLDILRAIRTTRPELPVLILTARDSLPQRIAGLDAGADDYIIKPFELTELEARLRAVLRRPGQRQSPIHQFAGLSFDTATRAAHCGTELLELTPREASLFEELVRTGPGIAVRDTLLERLYRADEEVSANALEAILSRLRRKLAQAGARVQIETMRGIGYRLKPQ